MRYLISIKIKLQSVVGMIVALLPVTNKYQLRYENAESKQKA